MSGVQLDNFANEISCNFGFAVKLEWLGEVLQLLQTAHAGGFLHMPREQQLQLVLEQLLNADLRVAGAGGHLPAAVKDLHKQTMQGKYMLQLDEAVNIAAGFKDRYREQGPNRCLKLHLTDGVQSIVAMEYRHIPALAVLMPAGVKLLLVNPEVRRGMLLLQPENLVVLGGMVAHLEAARQSLLQHVNKPADHCAQRRTCEQIYQQAAQAAWAGAQQQQQQQQQQQPPTSAAAGVGQAASQAHAPGDGATATAGWQQQQQGHQQQQQSGRSQQQQQYADTGQTRNGSSVHQTQQQQTWQQQAPQQAQQQPLQQQQQQVPLRPQRQQQQWPGVSNQGTMPPPAPRQTPPSASNQQGQQQQHSAVNAVNAGSRVAQINSSGQVWSDGNAAAAAGNSRVADDVEDYGFDEDEQLLDVSVPLGNTTVAATAMASRAGDDNNMGVGVDNSDTDMTTDDEQLQQHEQQQRQQPGHDVYPDSTDFPALGLQQQQRRQQQQLPADDVGSSSDDDIEIIEAEHTAAATIAGVDQQLQQPPYQQQLQQPLHEGSDSDGDFLDHALDQQLLALQSAQKLAHGVRLTKSNEDSLHAPQGMSYQQPRQKQPQQQRVVQDEMDWHFDEPQQQQQAEQQQQQQPVLRRRRKRQLQIPDDSSDDEAAAGTDAGSEQPQARQQQRPGQQQQQRMTSFGDDVGNLLPKSPQTISQPLLQQQQQQRLVGIAADGVRTPPPDVDVSGTPAAAAAAVMADVPGPAVESKAQHSNVGTGSGGSSGGGGSGLGSGFGSRRMLSVSQRKREIQKSQQQQAPASSQQQQQLVEPWRPQHATRLSIATQKAASVVGQQQHLQQHWQQEPEADNMVSPIDTFTPSAQHTDNQTTRPSTAAAAAVPDMHRRRTSSSSAPQPLTLQKSDPLRGRRSSAAAAADCINVAAATGWIVNGIDRESGMAAAAADPVTVAAAGVGSQKPAAAMTNGMGTSDWYGSLLQDLGCADDADDQTHDNIPVSAAAAASGTKTKLPSSSSSRVISSPAVGQDNVGNNGNARRTAGVSGSGSSRLSAGSGGSRPGAGASSDSKRVGANIKSLFARVNEFAAAGALPLKQQSSNGGLLSQQQAGKFKLAGQQRAAAANTVIVLDEDLDDPGAQLEDWD